jgi:hypothetical protein
MNRLRAAKKARYMAIVMPSVVSSDRTKIPDRLQNSVAAKISATPLK